MENFTALGANEITKNITFQGEMHKKFFCFIYRNVETKMCIIRH